MSKKNKSEINALLSEGAAAFWCRPVAAQQIDFVGF
jgi:hypothetical protein